MILNLLKNKSRRLRWWMRSGLGKDLYYRRQVKYPIDLVGGDARGNGAWPVYTKLLNTQSIVYSFGIGTDISFDLAMIERFGFEIYAFDPTPTSIAWLERQITPVQFRAYPYGLANYDGEAQFHAPSNPDHVSFSMSHDSVDKNRSVIVPVYQLHSLMQMFGHEHIDLLKIDIEGGEYDVIADILDAKIEVTQLLVEFHHRIPGIGLEQTRRTVARLNNSGFDLAYISSSGEEYVFLRG